VAEHIFRWQLQLDGWSDLGLEVDEEGRVTKPLGVHIRWHPEHVLPNGHKA
jgi:hypothetical protein